MYPFKDEKITIDCVQFASDGNWEDVQVVRFNEPNDIEKLTKWLDNANDDIAAEVLLLNDDKELEGFLGIRKYDVSSPERTLAWVNFTMEALHSNQMNFTELVNNTFLSIGLPAHIPNAQPTFELGVFNFWKSAKPMLLGPDPLSEIKNLNYNNNTPFWFIEGHDAPICIEYVWYDPVHIWVSKVASHKTNKKHHVDLEFLEKLLQR